MNAVIGLWRSAAEQGHADAQYNLGFMYDQGKGLKQDFGEAVRLFRKAADQGDVKAHCNLGVMYVQGQGVKQDLLRPCGCTGRQSTKDMPSPSSPSAPCTPKVKA